MEETLNRGFQILMMSYDDKGDIIFYECKQENDDNIDNSLLQEKRDDVFIMVLSQSSV
jgi:hypothetical protein